MMKVISITLHTLSFTALNISPPLGHVLSFSSLPFYILYVFRPLKHKQINLVIWPSD